MKKILGIPLVLFVIGILFVGSTLALLVTYLSNTVTHTIDVSTPLEMTGDTSLTLSIYGGENIYYKVTTINHANTIINSYPITEVTSPVNWAGNEFTQLWLEDPYGLWNITSIIFIVKSDGSLIPFSEAGTLNTKTLKLFFDNTAEGVLHTYPRGFGFNEWNYIIITTNPAITPGQYIIKSCQLYDWHGDC